MATTLTCGIRVIRKANTGYPVIGTIAETWQDRRGRERARVHWDKMLTGTSRWGTGGTDIYSNLLITSLLPASDALVAERMAMWRTARDLRIAERNAQRAGAAYPVQYEVFNVTDGEPVPVGHRVTGSTAASVEANLKRYQQQYPNHRFAILAYQVRWDARGEKTIREMVTNAAA